MLNKLIENRTDILEVIYEKFNIASDSGLVTTCKKHLQAEFWQILDVHIGNRLYNSQLTDMENLA